MRSALFLALVLAPALVAPAALRAQRVPSPYTYLERAQSLGAQTGYVVIDEGQYDTNPRSGPLLELRYDGRFAGPVSAVAFLGAIPTERAVYTRADTSAAAVRLQDASSLLVMAEAGLRLSITGPRTWHGLQPSIAATGGIVADAAGRTEQETQLAGDQLVALGPALAVGLTLGTDWYPTERISVGARATDHIWRRRTPAGLTDSGTRETDWTQNVGLTVGAAFHF